MATKKTSSPKKAPTAKKAVPTKKAPVKRRITESSIRKRAEEIYQKRIKEGIPGDADSDWRLAEEELRKQ
jgi:hypothetical protein